MTSNTTDLAAEFGGESLAQRADGWLLRHGEQLLAWRRDLHRHPELSRHETRTTDLVVSVLTELGLVPERLPAGTGVICDIPGPDGAVTVGLRADMDALPIAEATGLPFTSTVAGASHACGHDAHTAILLATASILAQAALPVGVRLIFQPAEEVMPGGALDAVAAGATAGLHEIYALHCDPKLEVGRVGVTAGPITSAADTLEVVLHSAGGHTSRPHLTGDLVHAMGTIITGLPTVLSRRVDPRTSTIMVWGAAHAGDAPNAIPQQGVLRGTVRTADHDTWLLLEAVVSQVIADLVAPLNVSAEVRYQCGVPPVVNDPACVDIMRASAAAIGPNAVAEVLQSGGGEDFSWYLEEIPGSMGRLGVWSGEGEPHDLHQARFVLDERALAVGVRTFVGIVERAAAR